MPNSITPPPGLVKQWFDDARNAWAEPQHYVATQAAQWGADQELEACCRWLPKLPPWSANDLRKHRRPKPLSLKEQALGALDQLKTGALCSDSVAAESTIRRALEALDD